MRKIVFLILMLMAFTASGCSSRKRDEGVKKPPVAVKHSAAKKETAGSLLTKEGMEKKLRELGVAVYPQAVFDRVAFRYNNYSIAYNISPATQEARDKVDEYYASMLKKLEENGWKKTTVSSSMYIYNKGKESFSWAHGFNENAGLNRIIFSYSSK